MAVPVIECDNASEASLPGEPRSGPEARRAYVTSLLPVQRCGLEIAPYFNPMIDRSMIYNKEDPSDIQIKIETSFYSDDQVDAKGNPLEISPLEFLGKKHFKFRGAIKIENVYVGSKISLQCKIYDGVVRPVNNERKRLTTVSKSVQESLLDEE